MTQSDKTTLVVSPRLHARSQASCLSLDVLVVGRNKSFPLEAEKVVTGSCHPKIWYTRKSPAPLLKNTVKSNCMRQCEYPKAFVYLKPGQMVSVIIPYSFRHITYGKSKINAQSTVLKISLIIAWLNKQNSANPEYLTNNCAKLWLAYGIRHNDPPYWWV